jgi:protein-S-isoprenylcysteine O-methyltransferase Ste14
VNLSYSSKHQNLAGEHPLNDLGQLILFLALVLVIVLDVFLFKFSNKIIGKLPWIIAAPLFFIFFKIGSYFILKSHKIIFKETEKEIGVVTSGVFHIVRHPMYFGSVFLFFSFVVLSSSILAFLIWLLICLFYYFMSRYEEKLLINKFGNKYKEYQKRVPMILPFL